MRKTTRILGGGGVAAFALVLFGSSPLAAQQTTTFNLTGVNTGAVLAGVYTSPYYGSVGSNPATIPVICDDFGDNSYNPEQWTAYVTSLSSLPANGSPDDTLKWNGANSVSTVDGYSWDLTNQTEAYTVAAVLVLDILQSNPNTTAGLQAQEDYSFALWELFDANGALPGELNWGAANDEVVPWLSNYSSDLSAATADVKSAIGAVTANPNILSGYNVTIYSYDPAFGTSCPSGNCPPPPQEFITVTAVPEPSSLAVLGVYFLFGGGSLLFFGRRRIFRADS